MSDMMRPIAIDLFCGAGGMSLGFEQAGFRVAAAIDIDPQHVATHKANFPHCSTLHADVSMLTGDGIRAQAQLARETIAVVFGGPPCQGFSLIGKRRVDDPRSLLVDEFARLVIELRPLSFVLENVAGLLVGNSRLVVERFIDRVEQAGFSVVTPVKHLDAADFGVPQRRRRVFIIGVAKGLSIPAYPDPSDTISPTLSTLVWDAIGDLPEVELIPDLMRTDVYLGELGEASQYALTLRGDLRDPSDFSQPRESDAKGLSGCRRTLHSPETVRRFAATEPGTSEPISRFYRLSKTGLATTIRAGTGPDNGSFMAPRPIHPETPRCITAREAARLHSFPDWFDFHTTKWHAFRQIGNSVPPRLARAVARNLIASVRRMDQTST